MQYSGGLDIESEMSLKYMGSAYPSKPRHYQLSLSSEEKANILIIQFFAFIRKKQYKDAYELAENLKLSGKCSSSVKTFAKYIKDNLLNGKNCIHLDEETE